MLMQLIKSKNQKPADSIDAALGFMGTAGRREVIMMGHVFKGLLSQWHALPQTLAMGCFDWRCHFPCEHNVLK